jgi:sodium/potassium-transporting ATPase subunit alpha
LANHQINAALIFETLVAIAFSYIPATYVFKMYPLKGPWWFLAIPFSVLLFVYDEIRKYIMRQLPPGSWIYQETYY